MTPACEITEIALHIRHPDCALSRCIQYSAAAQEADQQQTHHDTIQAAHSSSCRTISSIGDEPLKFGLRALRLRRLFYARVRFRWKLERGKIGGGARQRQCRSRREHSIELSFLLRALPDLRLCGPTSF